MSLCFGESLLPCFLLHPFHPWSLLSVVIASCRKLLNTSSQSSGRRPGRRSWMCRGVFTPRPKWLSNWDGMSHALKRVPHHSSLHHFTFQFQTPIPIYNHVYLFCIPGWLSKHRLLILGFEEHLYLQSTSQKSRNDVLRQRINGGGEEMPPAERIGTDWVWSTHQHKLSNYHHAKSPIPIMNFAWNLM